MEILLFSAAEDLPCLDCKDAPSFCQGRYTRGGGNDEDSIAANKTAAEILEASQSLPASGFYRADIQKGVRYGTKGIISEFLLLQKFP
ncbi:hypothetical protein ES703_124206 [subsurface metagenome]